MEYPFVNIHTHRPAGSAIGLRTTGIHPWQAAEVDPAQLSLPLPPPDGIQAAGEIGLDFARKIDRAKQEALLRRQLAWAQEAALPVVLHCVRAFEPMLRILAQYRLRGVIFHGFIGSPEQAHEALRRGYRLSFGLRTFDSPKTLRAMRSVPLESIFLETDDDPAEIGTVYGLAAGALGVEVGTLRERIYRNYENLFDHGDK